MKPLIKLAVTAALLAATSLTAWARPNGGGIIDRLDTDGDGLVSQMEMKAGENRLFERMDTDGNGSVSLEEVQANMQGRLDEKRARLAERHAERTERMKARFAEMDADKNGLVTAEEADAAAFAKFDGNGDGYISREEARSVKKAMRKGYRERRKNRRSKSDSE